MGKIIKNGIIYGGAAAINAVINLTVTADFIGSVITCTDGSATKTWTVDSLTHVFSVGLGTWTISSVVSGTTYSTEVVVTEYTTYTASLSMASYQGWLDSAGITTQYASLAEVLADEKTVRTLFTKFASVDYLVSWAQIDNVSATTILNNDYCAKWINLRDYALDTLYADTTCGALMDSADKYFYGEWVYDSITDTWGAKGNVPIMTSNSAPYGEAFTDESSVSPYQVFDGNDAQGAQTYWGGKSIGYKFTNPICLKQFKIVSQQSEALYRWNTLKIQVSNDGTNYTDLGEFTNTDHSQTYINTVECEDYFLYARVLFGTISQYTAIFTIQFYGRELKVSVPTMTSNTAPWGEVIASGNTGAPYPYKAFINDNTNFWAKDNDKTAWVGYDFGAPVICKFFRFNPLSSTTTYDYTYKLQGSNDKAEWNDITNVENFSTSVSVKYHGENSANVVCTDFISDTPYRYLRYKQESTSGQNTNGGAMQFYCLDYSEHEERHWIYDHGVEVEEIETYTVGNGVCEKRSDELYCYTPTNSDHAYFNAKNEIDITSYALAREHKGKQLVATSGNIFAWIATSTTKRIEQYDSIKNIPQLDIPNNASADITNINGNHYVLFGYGGNNANAKDTVTELWLE